MKFSLAVTTIVSTILSGGVVANAQEQQPLPDTPYKLVFYYKEYPKDNCDCTTDFYRIVDSIYQEFAHELVFTTSVNYSDLDKLDPRWNKVAGFYESRSKNIEKYRGDYDIWSGRDKYSPDAHYDVIDIMYTDPLLDNTDTPSTPVSVDTRGKFAQDYTTTHSADNTIALTDDKGQRQRTRTRRLRSNYNRLLRGLQEGDCGLQVTIGRTYEPDCTSSTITKATGSKTYIDTMKQGSGAAELFYENIDLYLSKHTHAPESCMCQDTLNQMKYAVVPITL